MDDELKYLEKLQQHNQAMPEHGEGWDEFASRIKLEMQGMEEELVELATENHRLRIALHEAINRPKGIVPHEAEEFYDQDFYSTTTAQ